MSTSKKQSVLGKVVSKSPILSMNLTKAGRQRADNRYFSRVISSGVRNDLSKFMRSIGKKKTKKRS